MTGPAHGGSPRPAPPTRLRRWASFVTRWIDPLIRPLAGILPGFGVLTHVGRRSGRVYRTPLNVFRRGDRLVVALTYGSEVQWVRNVRAAGGCGIRMRGRDYRLVDPRLHIDPELRDLPWLPRVIERANRVSELLSMRISGPDEGTPATDPPDDRDVSRAPAPDAG
jgi:deazaflavin-dependent oxidoreductase (nitroreductase family)